MALQSQEYKQVILVRQDLKLPKGKLAAQVGHACVDAALESDKRIVAAWKAQGMKKIVLKVKDEKELLELERKCQDAKLITSIIIDAGHTVLKSGTMTCVGIGPDLENKIDRLTSHLKML